METHFSTVFSGENGSVAAIHKAPSRCIAPVVLIYLVHWNYVRLMNQKTGGQIIMAKKQNVTKRSAETVAAKKERQGRASGFRVGAVILWLLAIAFEVLVILILNQTIYIAPQMVWIIVGIAIDLVLVIIGSLLWKKSNDIDPASDDNKLKFFLWNNMGIIAAVAAFLPLIILLLKDKKLDPKMKKIVTAIAGVALLIAVAFSIDWNPTSENDLKEAQAGIGDGTVYWTMFGKSYHEDEDCHTIRDSLNKYSGTIEEAFEANRNDPCDFCVVFEDDEAVEEVSEE
jgi:hypothetical protein